MSRRDTPIYTPAEEEAFERRAAAALAEYERLQKLHPNSHVAYRDTWDGTTLRREVVAASASFDAVMDVVDLLPDAEQHKLVVTYIEYPDTIQAVSVWLPDETTESPQN